MERSQPNFDGIARPYRWLEYLTLGPALTRCRNHFLPELADRRTALVLGDGDGRFLARLLAGNPDLEADAVDLSAAMLGLLSRRARGTHPTASARLRTYAMPAQAFLPTRTYDLVVTHFFLDCLTQEELERLVEQISKSLAPEACWLISDFQVPYGAMRWPAQLLIRGLYLAFRVLTGLRVTRLPDHAGALTRAGFTRTEGHTSLAGLLTTEIWSYTPVTEPEYTSEHATAATAP